MDHQVQHDADVHRAEGEAGGPHGLDELRLLQVRRGGGQRRVEALDVPDLEHDLPPPGHFDQLVGLGKRRRERLFDQQVRARLEKIDRQAMVRHRGRGDHRGIDLADQRLVRSEAR